MNWLQSMEIGWKKVKEKIEEYCIERVKKGVTPIFTVRWIIALNNIPGEDLSEVRKAMGELRREGKIKKYGSKSWQWIGKK